MITKIPSETAREWQNALRIHVTPQCNRIFSGVERTNLLNYNIAPECEVVLSASTKPLYRKLNKVIASRLTYAINTSATVYHQLNDYKH